MNKSIFIALTLVVSFFLLVSTIRIELRIDVETGLQDYERSIMGYVLRGYSEYGYRECKNWTNPMPGKNGKKVLSSCYLFLFGCRPPEIEMDVVASGCNKTIAEHSEIAPIK